VCSSDLVHQHPGLAALAAPIRPIQHDESAAKPIF
jgi:hypothetical protein